jgi:hypothetical protein
MFRSTSGWSKPKEREQMLRKIKESIMINHAIKHSNTNQIVLMLVTNQHQEDPEENHHQKS